MLTTLIFVLTTSICFAGRPSPVVRPCSLNDFRCLQDNFASNSNCSRRVLGFIPAEYVIDEFRFEVPYYNSTFVDNNLLVRNHHRCFLTDFFFNVPTNSALISADCPGLRLQARRTLFLHQTKQEDLIYHYDVTVYYPLVRLTMNIKNASAIDTCSSFTFGDVVTLPSYSIVPTDEASAGYMPFDSSWLPILERENWLPRAQPVMRYIINRLICDFKCL